MMICLVPDLRFLRLISGEREGMPDDVTNRFQRKSFILCKRLNQDISGGGRLDWPGHDFQAGGIGCKLAKEFIFYTTAYNVQDIYFLAGKIFQSFHYHMILKGKAFQYWKWLKAHGESLPEKPLEDAEQFDVADSTNAKLCPECGHFLSRKRVGHGVNFQIDRCATCGGFWFDKNEWEILKNRNLHDDVHFIFSSAWQHRILDEDLRETYSKRIEIILGQQDWTKARDFKRWTASHPERNTIMAFLADLDV